MKQTVPVTDERLDVLLDSMRAEGAQEPPAPPVINPFRLEMENARRADKRQSYLAALAVVLSVLATTALTAICVRLFSPQINAFLQSPPMQRFCLYVRMCFRLYGGQMAAVTAILLTLLLLGCILCGVLMVKYRDKLFVL